MVPTKFHSIVKQTIVDGENVVVIREDHSIIGPADLALPVVGVFKVKDGKIAAWTDYFDMATLSPVVTMLTLLKKP